MAKKTKEKDLTKKQQENLRQRLVAEMLKLSTSGLGLVAALAWNELIKELVEQYIKPLVGESSGVISLFIYALVVTILAVTVTYQLTKIVKKS